MKTLYEVKYSVATECGYKNFEALADEILSDYELFEFYLSVIAIEYASQFIDAAADNVEIEYTPYENGNDKDWEDFTSTSGEWFRVDKQTILKLKDQLK